MNIKNNRKFKYGALAVTLTCVTVALIIAFNMIFTSLSSRFGWYVDMTEERLFELSDSTARLLEGYREMEDFEIKFVFCQEADRLDEEFYTRILHNMVKQYADTFNFVKIEYVNINLHPGAVEQYKKSSQTRISATSLIIDCGKASRVHTLESFFIFEESDSSTPIAFDGEYKITAAILSMVEDNPIAYFTTGHSEDAKGSAMYQLFEEAGFTVKEIDLSKEDPEKGAMVMVINNPKYDFAGASQSVNEIAKIDKFADDLGNLMVFLDTAADQRRFTELNEYLEEWGMRFEEAHVYDYENALTQDGTELVAEYAKTEGPGSQLTSQLTAIENPPKVVVNNARPITILPIRDMVKRLCSPVLTTSSTGSAVAVPFQATSNEEGEKGIYNLMAMAVEVRYINNVDCYNYVLCAGTSSFADDRYIGNAIYGNRDLIFNAMKTFGKGNVPIDLDFKMFDNEGLDLTAAEANRWTIILCAILPAIAFVAGAIVYVRRKHA